MEPTATKKKNKKQRLRTVHDELSRNDDMLRTHYPKRCPTYLVAFSLKETYDDLATAQQMICKHSTPEHSPQESTNSITPKGSFKILETELDETNVIAKNKPSSSGHSSQVSTNSITPNRSFKILEPELGESNIIAKNKPSSPEQSLRERTNIIAPTGSFKKLETELEESKKIANNKPERHEHSPQGSPNSITPTGSFKTLESELEESQKIANNKPERHEYSPQESPNSITPTGSFKTLESELEESKKIAKNKPESPEHSPQESTYSITPTGSFKLLEIELDKSNTVAKINYDHNPMRKNSSDSITPTNSFKEETKRSSERRPILDKKHSENKPVCIQNSVHSSIYSKNSSTPTSSLKFSSSDYSTGSRITIGEKQKVTIDFTAFGTDSEEPSTTECSDTPGNAVKCEVVPQQQKEFLQSIEKNEKYITVYVYDESDNKSDRDNTGNTVNTGDSGNTDATDDKGNDEEVCFVSDKINDDTNLSQENRNNIIEPKSIFKADTKNRALKKKRSFRGKYNNGSNIKQKKFKCKFTKKKIDVRLEKYYEKRNNSIDADQIQLDLYSDEVSTVVSRTQVVHKKARENLLKTSDINMFASDLDDERSLTSSPSTARETLMSVSESSQNTLVQEPSTISNDTDILDMIKVNEDIEVDHVRSLLKMPNVTDIYKSEVVSIPVTVAYDRSTVSRSKNENHLLTSQETSEEIYTFMKLPLTSCEKPLISNTVTKLNAPSSDMFDNVTIKPSNNTLINMNTSFPRNSSNDFYNARTSSQFSKCIDSYSTLTNDRNTVIDMESTTEDSVLEKEAMIFETVINLDRCDETPSTSSKTPSSNDLPYFNNIIVANVPNDKQPKNHGNKEKENIRKTILSKSTDQPTEKVPNKMLNLPNQIEIKAMLREKEMPQIKCGEEMRNPPNIPPLWERLMSALEMAVHRLEDNLVEKIMKEIQKPIVKYPEPKSYSSELTSKAEQAATTADCENLSVQCDLVKSTTIDKIMGILSSEGSKTKDPSTLNKVDLFNDIEVIISPNTTRTLTEKDQITISTLTTDSLKLHHRLSWIASVPVSFIRENMLVITSVPTFFVFLLCIYSLIQFVMKPWW